MNDQKEFVDYYEILEASVNANFDTIERIFRYMAKRYHPDHSEHGDIKKFTQLVEAYEVLKDPEQRAEYDARYESSKSEEQAIVQEAGHADSDCEDRHRLLTLFYAKRRRNMKEPGLGINTVEQMMNLPVEVLDFHMWYFREKGWVQREEGGAISITALGVDKIESTVEKKETEAQRRITEEKNRIA